MPRYTVLGGHVLVSHRDGLQTYESSFDLEVLIDGVLAPLCFRVDTDEGWVKAYVCDKPHHTKMERVQRDDMVWAAEPVVQMVFGKVEVRRRQR